MTEEKIFQEIKIEQSNMFFAEDTNESSNVVLFNLKEVASYFHVSLATVRNWVKLGYLSTFNDKFVSKKNVIEFENKNIGTTRLTSRANKTRKNKNNYIEISNQIRYFLQSSYSSKFIMEYYENNLSESYKNQEGIYYTPMKIVKELFDSVSNFDEDITFLDPCCGSGNFIIEAINRGIKPNNIYGFDTDLNAVEITKRRIFELTGYESDKIFCADFLSSANEYLEKKVDLIFTNPPWGKKYSSDEKKFFSKIYHSGSSNDSFSFFFFACLNYIKEEGYMGFIFPESVLNVSSFEMMRKVILDKKIEKIIDYDKVFSKVYTKVYAIILNNIKANSEHKVACKTNLLHYRLQNSFKLLPNNILNVWATQDETDIILNLYNMKHTTLSNNTKWGLGIVTGNNKDICANTPNNDRVPIYRGKDIFSDSLSTPELFINKDLKSCQQVAPIELYKAKEKLIYRFISSKLVFYRDVNQSYILNSANMLILDEKFPINTIQLSSLLNSRLMNWIFSKIFNTHKILRKDLEQLPIFVCDVLYKDGRFDEAKILQEQNLEEVNGTFCVKR